MATVKNTNIGRALGSGTRNRMECLIVGAVFKCQRMNVKSCPFRDLIGLPLGMRAKLILSLSDEELIKALEAHDSCPCSNTCKERFKDPDS